MQASLPRLDLRAAALLTLFLALACRGPAGFGPNVSGGGLALGGRDPVSYFDAEGGPVAGSAELTAEVEGATYRFASEDSRAAFLADPARYAPAYGGWCAYAMADGEFVTVDLDSYLIEDGRLLLFYDGLWGDTRAMWQEEGPEALRERADEEWARIAAEAEGDD